MRKIRILIVDDSITIRAMVEQILTNDPGIEVVGIAGNAAEAWAFMHDHLIDVVTLDIMMPGLNGLEFLSDIMTKAPLPVVMISSLTARGCAERGEALQRGATACFDKATIISNGKQLVAIIKRASRCNINVLVNRDAIYPINTFSARQI